VPDPVSRAAIVVIVTLRVTTEEKERQTMPLFRVALAFAGLSDGDLPPYTTQVINNLTGNPHFPNPPVSLPDLTTANNDYLAKLAVMEDGTKQDKVAKDIARRVVENMLRQEAAYVQSIAGENLEMLLSSGFEAVKTNRAQVALEKPVIERVENPASTQLALRLKPVETARAYEVRMSFGTNGWQAAGIFTKARKIVLQNLTPGTTYTVQARAIGGLTGSSEWSDPVSHMSL
jgi:hypothetical protein